MKAKILALIVMVAMAVCVLASCSMLPEDLANKLQGAVDTVKDKVNGIINPNGTPDAHEHNFVEGKCECGATDPEYVAPHEHNFVEGKCECGATDPEYVAPHEHNFVEGKCECGETDPTYVPPTPAPDGTSENPYALTVPGELNVALTDGQYIWYTFTATETKTLGITLSSANAIMGYGLNADNMTYIPEGATYVTVDLVADTTYVVNFGTVNGAAEEYNVTAAYVEKVDPYTVIIVAGKNTLMFSAAEIEAGSATRTFRVDVAGVYQFNGDAFVDSITNADGVSMKKENLAYALEAGEYTVTFGMFSIFGTDADTAIEIEVIDKNAPEEPEKPEEPEEPLDTEKSELVIGDNTVTVTDAQIADETIETIDYTIVVKTTGAFNISINGLFANIYNENGDFIGRNGATLKPGTYTVSVYIGSITNAGDYTLTLEFTDIIPGSVDDPFVLEEIPADFTYEDAFDVYYVYTATADCAVIVKTETGSVLLNVGEKYFYDGVAFIKAGETVTINLFAYDEDKENVNEHKYDITLGEYAEDGDFNKPIDMYQGGVFSCEYPGGNDVDKFVWFKSNIYEDGLFVITFANRVNAKYGTDPENLIPVTDATTKIAVSYGDVLYLAVQSFDLSAATISFETAWEYLPGTYDKPYNAVVGDNSENLVNGSAYFVYAPDASGAITLVVTEGSLYYYDNVVAWNWVEVSSGSTMDVSAGREYEFRVDNDAENATTAAFNLAFEEKTVEIEGELVKTETIVTPANMDKSDAITFTATEAGKYIFVVTGKDSSTWFQIYDAAEDTWAKITNFPHSVVLEANATVEFRLFGWSDDAAVAGSDVKVDIYYAGAVEGGEEVATGTVENPNVITESDAFIVIVPAETDIYYTYTNNTNSEVTVTIAVEGSNYYIRYGTYSFMLLDKMLAPGVSSADVAVDAGATLYIKVSTYNAEADAISFSVVISGEQTDMTGSGVNNDPFIIEDACDITANVPEEGSVFYAYTNNTEDDVTVVLSFNSDNFYLQYGTYSFMLLDKMLSSNDPVSSVEVAVSAGATLFIKVKTYDATAGNVDFSVSFADNGAGEAPVAESDLVIGNNAVNAADAVFVYNATSAITLTIAPTTAIMGPVEITYSVNDGSAVALVLGESVDVVLAAGDKLVLNVTASGYNTIVVSEKTACAHENTTTTNTATCTAAGIKTVVCDDCGATVSTEDVEALGHTGHADDFKCDVCSETVLPAADSVLTIKQAIALGKLFTKDTYTTAKYYVTGVIVSVERPDLYGNITIKDEAGNELLIYGTYSADGNTQYGSLTVKPGKGDVITVYGIIGYYTASQMKNGWITEHTAHTCEYSEATCTEPATCVYCGVTTGTTVEHAYVNGTCSVCGATEGVSYLEATMKYTGTTTGNMTGNNDAAKVGLDATIFSVIGNKGSTNNNCGLNKSGQIRLYGNSAGGNGSYFTVSVAEGYTIKSIKITFSNGTNCKNCQLSVDGTVIATTSATSTSTTLEADINADSFKLQNVIKGNTTQIYIASIEIVYSAN